MLGFLEKYSALYIKISIIISLKISLNVLSHVRCQLSCVTRKVKYVVKLAGGGLVINEANQYSLTLNIHKLPGGLLVLLLGDG